MPAISYVGATHSTANSSSSFQLNKPSGTAQGDFIVAILGFHAAYAGAERTVTPPTGWVKVDDKYVTANSKPHQISVMSRTVGASDPSSWNGSISSSVNALVALTITYRNVVGIAASGTSSKGSGSSYSTATVNNPVSANWRITAGGYSSGSVNYDITSNEVILHKRIYRLSGLEDIQVAAWDSNGTISTGNTSRTISRGAVWSSSCSWIGILDANDVTYTGTLQGTLPELSMTADAELGYSGTMAATLPEPTMTGTGIASPPEGTLDVLILPEVGISGALDGAGTLDTLIVPVVNIVGETRKFGLRVVTPTFEHRVIVPILGAVGPEGDYRAGTRAPLRGLEVRLPRPDVSFDTVVGSTGSSQVAPLTVAANDPWVALATSAGVGASSAVVANGATISNVGDDLLKYAVSIGDGTNTSYTVTHNFGSRDVIARVYDNTTFEEIRPDVVHATTNTVTVGFAVAPSTNAYRVVVLYSNV